MDLGLKGKVVIVTGGSKGLGAGICEVFAKEGANVVINYHRNKEEGEAFANRLANDYGVETLAIQGDVTIEADIINIFTKTIERFGTVDTVVNNAYFNYGTKVPIDEFNLENFKMVERITIEAALITSRELIKHCKEKNKVGHIIMMSSKSAFLTSSPWHACYASMKGAMAAVAREIAYEAGKYNIYCNAIIPGYAMNSKIDVNSERYKRTIELIPTKRYATPEEIGNVVAFVCSEKACQMNGALIDVTGGTMSGQM